MFFSNNIARLDFDFDWRILLFGYPCKCLFEEISVGAVRVLDGVEGYVGFENEEIDGLGMSVVFGTGGGHFGRVC